MTMTLIAVGLAGLAVVPGADLIRTIRRTAEDPQTAAAVEHTGADEAYADDLAAMTVEIPPAPAPGRHRRYEPEPLPVELASYANWTAATTDTALMDPTEVNR